MLQNYLRFTVQIENDPKNTAKATKGENGKSGIFFAQFQNLSRHSRQSQSSRLAIAFDHIVSHPSHFVDGGLRRDCRGRRKHTAQ